MLYNLGYFIYTQRLNSTSRITYSTNLLEGRFPFNLFTSAFMSVLVALYNYVGWL